MEFNLNFDGIQTTASAQRRLKPWNIYPVKWMGASHVTVQGKKDPNMTYDILKLRFEGKEGYYEESIFYPNGEDTKRPVYTNKEGHEYESPSRWEMTKQIIAQLVSVVCPKEAMEKFFKYTATCKSFNDIVKGLIQVTDKYKGAETNLKLIGRNKDGMVEPVIPRICGVNKQGELFLSDNFIGENLFFTPYEEGKRNEYLSAAPTKMPTKEAAPAEVNTEEVDELLAGL